MSIRSKQCKCRCCRKCFFPDFRNHDRQHYCAKPACRQASKAASQRRWSRKRAKRIIESVDNTTVLGYRDRTILEVLYATGIRNQELRNLTVADVNLEEGLLRVNHGKGAKDRVTPLGQIAGRFLETYLNGIRSQLLGQRHSVTGCSCRTVGSPLMPIPWAIW